MKDNVYLKLVTGETKVSVQRTFHGTLGQNQVKQYSHQCAQKNKNIPVITPRSQRLTTRALLLWLLAQRHELTYLKRFPASVYRSDRDGFPRVKLKFVPTSVNLNSRGSFRCWRRVIAKSSICTSSVLCRRSVFSPPFPLKEVAVMVCGEAERPERAGSVLNGVRDNTGTRQELLGTSYCFNRCSHCLTGDITTTEQLHQTRPHSHWFKRGWGWGGGSSSSK